MAENKKSFVKNPEKDFVRNRKLDFETTIKIILSMGANTLNRELYNYFEKGPNKIVTTSAFLQQREKIKEEAFEYLFHAFNERTSNTKTYKGYSLYAVDGSSIRLARNPNSETYIEGKWLPDGTRMKGHNRLHLNAVYDLLGKVYVDALLQLPDKSDERKAFTDMLERRNYEGKSIFIMDRGYPSWNVIAHFKYCPNVDYLIRGKGSAALYECLPMTEFDIDKEVTITTNHAYKGKGDNGIYFVKVKKNTLKNRPYSSNKWFSQWDFGEFEKLNLRILRFKISEDTYETIITSLPRDVFPLCEIKKLYRMRWGIETSFRELKYIIGLSVLHCKKDAYAVQEIFARLTMYNFCSRILKEILVEQDKTRKYEYKINFTMAMGVCMDFYKSTVKAEDFYTLINRYILPVRPDRVYDVRSRRLRSRLVPFVYRVV